MAYLGAAGRGSLPRRRRGWSLSRRRRRCRRCSSPRSCRDPRRQRRAAARRHHRLGQRRPPFTRGTISAGVMNLLSGPGPQPGRPCAAAPARHRPHLDSDHDTRALPGLPAAPGILPAAARRHRLPAAARVLPRLSRPGTAGGKRAGRERQAARGDPGPVRQRRRLTRRGLHAARAPSPTAKPGPTTATCTEAAPRTTPAAASRGCTCRWPC
jgi:hypothetical protein